MSRRRPAGRLGRYGTAQLEQKLRRVCATKPIGQSATVKRTAVVGECPFCKTILGAGGILEHDCEGLRESVARASSVEFDRAVLDVELLAHKKASCSECRGRGYTKRLTMPAGAKLAKGPDKTGAYVVPSGKDCGACKGEKTVAMPGQAGKDGAREPCPICRGSGKEQPRVIFAICPCAARRFAKKHRGEFASTLTRFQWLKGKAPPMPADWESPFLKEAREDEERVAAAVKANDAQASVSKVADLGHIPTAAELGITRENFAEAIKPRDYQAPGPMLVHPNDLKRFAEAGLTQMQIEAATKLGEVIVDHQLAAANAIAPPFKDDDYCVCAHPFHAHDEGLPPEEREHANTCYGVDIGDGVSACTCRGFKLFE